MIKNGIAFFILIVFAVSLSAQVKEEAIRRQEEKLRKMDEDFERRINSQINKMDNVIWSKMLKGVADIEKIYISGGSVNSTGEASLYPNSESELPFYLFFPVGMDFNGEYPLVLFPYDNAVNYSNVIRELIYQQYIVAALDIGGNSVYGFSTENRFDHGGIAIGYLDSVRNKLLEEYNFIDDNRVGILGFGNGGIVALENYLLYPDVYNAAFADAPINALLNDFGYLIGNAVENADYPLGRTVRGDAIEYGRNAASNGSLINDSRILIRADSEEGNILPGNEISNVYFSGNTKVDVKVFNKFPNGSAMPLNEKESRLKIWKFISEYLKPRRPIKSFEDMLEAEKGK